MSFLALDVLFELICKPLLYVSLLLERTHPGHLLPAVFLNNLVQRDIDLLDHCNTAICDLFQLAVFLVLSFLPFLFEEDRLHNMIIGNDFKDIGDARLVLKASPLALNPPR